MKDIYETRHPFIIGGGVGVLSSDNFRREMKAKEKKKE